MKTLNLMDLQFNYKAAFRGYESAVITRIWNGIGSAEIVINTQITNAGLIQQDDIVWFNKEYHKAYIIERTEEEVLGNEMKCTIIAQSINALIRDFITIPPSGFAYDSRTGTREQIARAWVTANAISPADASRYQYPIVLGDYNGLGSSITEQTRFKNLADEVNRVLSPQDLGWRVDLDIPGRQFVFKVLAGTDLTAGQSVNGRVLFGLKYGNLAGYKKVEDKTSAKNVAYTGGQGEGEARTIVKVDGSGSGRKKEVFVDARDLSDTDALAERGTQALNETAPISSLEFEALDRQFRYEQEYDLGDFVTVVLSRDQALDLQIKKVTEYHERESIKVIPEFGRPERTLKEVFSTATSRITNLETR